MFDKGEINLPLLQRDYVWKPNQIVFLFDSLFKGWPVGSFYLWDSDVSQKTKIISNRSNSYYLLDGQQRLTSLSHGIKDESANSPDCRVFFDIRNETFVTGEKNSTIQRRIEHNDPGCVPMSDLISLSRKHSRSHPPDEPFSFLKGQDEFNGQTNETESKQNSCRNLPLEDFCSCLCFDQGLAKNAFLVHTGSSVRGSTSADSHQGQMLYRRRSR